MNPVDRPGAERRAALFAFLAFLLLMAGYFVLRPLREEAGIAGGVRNIKWLYAGTFLGMLLAVPLHGRLVARWPRPQILALAFRFFIANILVFALVRLDDDLWVWGSRIFYCWLSVFSLFVVSLFWSFLVDLFRPEQCRRLFGPVATGGSLEAILGSLIVDRGLEDLGAAPLFLIPALFLELALRALRRSEMTLGRSGPATTTSPPDAEDAIIGGRLLDGLRALGRSRYLQWIALFLLCMTAASTFAYFEQANLVKRAWPDDPDARTRYFSRLNLAAQSLTLLFQALVTTALVRRIGLARTLLVLPGICLLGFLALGLAAADTATAARGAGVAIWVLAAFQVLQQATSRGLASPTRQMLFAPLTRTEKYKAKGFIDTVVYRGGDLVSGFAFDGLIALGLGLAGVAFVTMPLCLAWVLIAGMIGRRQPIEATTEVEATGTAG